MADIPFTRNRTSPEQEEAIRAAVRAVEALPSSGAYSRLAEPGDAEDFRAFLDDPHVAGWIYSLPRPLTVESVENYIRERRAARERGEGLLFLSCDEDGGISGYSDIQVWPQWAAGEIAGAIRPDRQNRGQGGAGMIASLTWMFEALHLDLICNTTARDNVRIQSLFEKTGFAYKGDTESLRPDGTTRVSQVWEVTRDAWLSRHAPRR